MIFRIGPLYSFNITHKTPALVTIYYFIRQNNYEKKFY